MRRERYVFRQIFINDANKLRVTLQRKSLFKINVIFRKWSIICLNRNRDFIFKPSKASNPRKCKIGADNF